MKFKGQYNKQSNKWFPRSITSGRTVSTEDISTEIADMGTVSHGDVVAVLRDLRTVMTRHLTQGDKVKLDNIGTFYLMADASGNGVATEEEVDASQINRVNVRFTPQKMRSVGGLQQQIPALAAAEIRWEKVAAVTDNNEQPVTPNTPDNPGGGDTPGGDNGGGNDNPGGGDNGGDLGE